jgi:hypothetical protein
VRIPGRIALAGLLAAAAGCARPAAAPAPDDGPLTVGQWKALPADRKYQAATFERLKDGDSKLRDEREWAKFTRDVLLPAKAKDRPGGAK